MKIYSSDLEFGASVNNGDLTITADDALIITDSSAITTGGDAVYSTLATYGTVSISGGVFNNTPDQGLYIPGGSFDTTMAQTSGVVSNYASTDYHYLDGKGVERSLNDILIQDVSLDGTDLIFWNGASGAASSLELFRESLGALAGGGAGASASTNPTAQFVPAKDEDAFGRNEFRDSAISETSTDSTPATFFVGNPTASVTAGATTFTYSIPTSEGFGAVYEGRDTTFRVETDNSSLYDVSVGTGSVNGANTEYPITAQTGVTFPAIATSETVQFINTDNVVTITKVQIGGNSPDEGIATTVNLEVSGDLQVDGDMTVGGTLTAVNQSQVDLNDSFILLNSVDIDQVATDITNVDGGIIILTDVDAAADTATYAGIRFNADSDGSGTGRWEVSNELNAADGSDSSGTWMPLSGVTKYAQNFDSSQTDVAVTTTDNVSTWVFTHNFETTDVIVNVYESNSAIIPDEVVTASNTVSVSLPDTITTGLRIVVLG